MSATAAPDPDRRRERTLAWAFALSAWAPLATAVAVLLSRSTTQLADFLRRSVELVAMGIAWRAARRSRRRPDATPADMAAWARGAERAVAWALAASAVLVLTGAAVGWRRVPGGDVRLGLVVALLGRAVNAAFWARYAALYRARPDAIVDGQRRLYRAKVAVDAAVVVALASVLLAPAWPGTHWMDRAGAIAVAGYLAASAWGAWRAAEAASS